MVKCSKTAGSIYCLQNKCLRKGLLKVGFTTRSPNERMKEANRKRRNATWIPPSKYRKEGFDICRYSCAYHRNVPHARRTEKKLFKLFRENGIKRIKKNREFFLTTVKNVDRLLKMIELEDYIAECKEKKARLQN